MAVDRQLVQSLLSRLISREAVAADSFALAADLCRAISDDSDAPESHELVLRAMENRDAFGAAAVILDGLIRQIGLFPYLDPTNLSLTDLLAYETHRPFRMDQQIVFHRAQAHVYHLLMAGENVALSAPMSFGKSLLIDAMVASGKYRNIVIVVPTLALIDETRRRLTDRFRGTYKIITRPSQQPTERNVYVLTQERVLERDDWSGIDFFVIDEFYKLAPQRENDDRCALLNQAFYALLKTGAQFYMLGPNINGITDANHLRVELRFVKEPDFHTIATEVHRIAAGDDEFAALADLCRNLDSPTIIFCRSPTRASEVARRLVAEGLGNESDRLKGASDWIGTNYDPEWHFAEALARGIGIHHGRIPRSLAQFVVRCFNEGEILFLACTSTLIEGVNTRARNIVVFDNTINRSPIDLFTFNNIKGRSGRMFQYFIGHVYVFHSDPQSELPLVDVPAFSQSGRTSSSLLVQMDDDDLTDESRERRARFVDQELLSFAVIRQNRGVEPELQLRIAERIGSESDEYKQLMAWTGAPAYDQLLQVCELMIDECGGTGLGNGSARTAPQLAMMIRNLRDRLPMRRLVQNQRRFSPTADDTVTRVLDFLRGWATFHFPRLLRAFSNIHRDVLGRQGYRIGNYEWYAGQVESLFLDPVLLTLEEFGIPLEVSRKLSRVLSTDGDLDTAIERLRRLELDMWPLTNFERELIEDARAHL